MKADSQPWTYWLFRWGLGAIFVYAGVQKVGDPLGFADSIATFDVLPRGLISPLALGLPVFEVGIGCLLILNWKARTASLGVMVMAAAFFVAIGQALLRGLEIDCGCLGGSGELLTFSGQLFAAFRAAVLFVVAFSLWRRVG